jgi:hypothetical protein
MATGLQNVPACLAASVRARQERKPSLTSEKPFEDILPSWKKIIFLILRRDDPFAQVVVPDHKELDRGTLRAIIRHAGLSVDEFVELL